MNTPLKPGLLLVANYDSAVGYAWWLMESYWATLAQCYQHAHTVHLAYPSISTVPETIASAPVVLHTMDFTRKDATAVAEQASFLQAHNIECIYFSDASAWHWRYLAFRLVGVKKIITHDHTPGLRTPPKGVKRLLKASIQRMPWISADGLLGATEFVRQRQIEVLRAPAEKCFAVPNGLPPPEKLEDTDVRQRFNIPAERKIMVMAARAHHYKGIDFALQCVADYVHRKSRSDLHFLFCGDGPHLAELEALATSLDIDDYVTFPGRCEYIDGIFQACDFAIQPSHGEVGYSLSILEYMRAGLPTIVPDNPSVCAATTHRETGLIYAEGNVEAATEAIMMLVDQPELTATLGANATERSEAFTLANSHAALISAVENVYTPAAAVDIEQNKA